jgi:acetoin utilization deacetylase AcuC-like enzyme
MNPGNTNNPNNAKLMAARTGFVYHEHFLDHDTGAAHPERPDRLRAIVSHFKETNLWSQLQHLIIERADENWLLKVHSAQHLAFIRESCKNGIHILDQGDTHAGKESYDVALLAVGGVLAGVDAVMSGLIDNAFCAVRPPGHHAGSNSVMGFCLINNVAVAARYAQEKFGVRKVAIIDWDVHHGNGTQEIFYEDPSVLYISTHQFPFYPGTGSRGERGAGKGEGYTLNIPMFAGAGEEEYLFAFQTEILPALSMFQPELILISAGFDAHEKDPLAHINLTEDTFARMTSMVREPASKYCGGKLVSVLEGGYDLQALPRSVEAHIRELMKA